MPRSGAGRIFVPSSVLLAGVHLLGQQGSSLLGAKIPEISPVWLLLVACGAFALLPQARPALGLGRWLAFAAVLCVTGWALAMERTQALRPPDVPATVSYFEAEEWVSAEEIRLSSLGFETRRDLARITQRRRDVKLSVQGALHVPDSGPYVFVLNCDDRCTLFVDGEVILDTAAAREAEVSLTSGRHQVALDYVQRSGPARCALDWRRPVWFAFLPIEHYIGDAGYSPAITRIAVSFGLSMLWWFTAFSLAARAGESRTAWRASLARASSSMWSWARRRSSGVVLGACLVGTGCSALAVIGGSVRVSAVRGDWKAVTSGAQPFGNGETLGAGTRMFTHFHELDGRRGALELDLRSAGTDPIRVDVWRDGARFESATIGSTRSTLRVPLARGGSAIDVGIEVTPMPSASGALYLIDEIRLVRAASVLYYALAIGLVLMSFGVAVISARRSSVSGAAVDGLLTSLLGAACLIYCMDPSRSLTFDETTRWGFRIVTLAALWVRGAMAVPSASRSVAAVGATVGLLYLPALRYGFVTDDFLFGRAMNWDQALSTLIGHWDPLGLANDHYRPVVALSLAWDYLLWGARTAGYHATNLVVHVLNGLLALVLFRRLNLPRRAALLGALAWCAHPMGAAAASWANERTDGIMAVFYIGTLCVLTAPRFANRNLVGVVVAGALALGSKEMAVTLPLTAFLVVYLSSHLTNRRLRYGSVAALASLVVVHVAFWVHLFPAKSTGAARLAVGLASASDWLGHPFALLYPSVFIPGDYGFWQSLVFGNVPPAYLVLGFVVWGSVFIAVRYRDPSSPAKLALLGGLWPAVTVPPLLGLSGGVDLFRVGWLTALGFGLTWAALMARYDRTAPLLRGLAAVVLAVWFGTASISSSRAWAPEGFVARLGTRWTITSAAWQSSLSPEMRELYVTQVERASHARRWVATAQ